LKANESYFGIRESVREKSLFMVQQLTPLDNPLRNFSLVFPIISTESDINKKDLIVIKLPVIKILLEYGDEGLFVFSNRN
jgi:hypothetical protein